MTTNSEQSSGATTLADDAELEGVPAADVLVSESVETAEDSAGDTAEGSSADEAGSANRVRQLFTARVRGAIAAILIVVLAVLVGVFAYLYVDADDAKSATDAEASQRAQAAAAAADYTTKSLTYSYQTTDAFFAAVKTNAGEALVKRYDEVRPTLTQIMQQAQVQATGRVLATSITGKKDGNYTVMVFANQKTQNVQNTQPSELPTLLKVVVTKAGKGWQILDYGPPAQ
ncbi:hypothetical protein ACQ7HM_12085 [Williamsia sp. MIQD14]|uniref:hypothetical protein n=1 Tax=Williamsia sp. MIQD14 TaxID=3425703 RepID=UPI003DA02874